jgi:Fe-S cluster assembly protein SufD
VSHRSPEDTSRLTPYLEAFAASPAGPNESAWFGTIRRQGIEHFAALGFPSRRQEEWRYTNIAPIAKQAFVPASRAAARTVDELNTLELPDFGGSRLVFVDGYLAEHLSRRLDDPALALDSLAEASAGPLPIRGSALAHYGTLIEAKDDGFAALNTAFASDGAVVTLKRGCTPTGPLQIVFVSSEGTTSAENLESPPPASFPRVLILAEAGSAGTIVQDHVSLGERTAFNCGVCEVVLEDSASLEMVLVQRESDATFHIARQHISQQRDSRFSLHTLNLGSAILRNELEVTLADEGAACDLRGLYLGGGQQLVDNHTLVDHAVPHCESRELYKGILADRARGVFRGRVVVRPGAQRTTAEQQNRNLLLSRKAEVDTKPQLEIYADDVKCNHGSSIGQLDEEALFFLRSRGLDESDARALLATGFAAQVTESIGSMSIRDWTSTAVGRHVEALLDSGVSA